MRQDISAIIGALLCGTAAISCSSGSAPATEGNQEGQVGSTVQALDPTPTFDSRGTDFWVMFNQNYGTPDYLALYIAGEQATTGTVQIPGLGFTTNFTLAAGVVTTVNVPVTAFASGPLNVSNVGIHVTAASPVTVYGINRLQYTTDAFLGLPTATLGTDYWALAFPSWGQGQYSQLGILGTQNNTTVTITPSAALPGHAAGTPFQQILNAGQAMQLAADGLNLDLSGTRIVASAPVAVYGGNRCANIPNINTTACDHVVEEIPPSAAWGSSFVTVPLATRIGGDTFRIIAAKDNTAIRINGVLIATLNSGQVRQQIISGSSVIQATGPVLVAQYSNGSSYDGVTSDPFMMLVPPYEQFLASYTVTTPATGFSRNFINIAIPTSQTSTFRFDGLTVAASAFAPIGQSGFSGAQLTVVLGSHRLTAAVPFGAFMYGFDSYDSYGYPGGLSVASVAVVSQVTLSVPSGTQVVGTQLCVTAAVRDQYNAAVPGVRVDYTATGANTASGFAFAGADGNAQLCYTGTVAGVDTLKATVGSVSGTGTVTWTSANRPPIADAGPDQTVSCAGSTNYVRLDGRGSSDPDNDVLSYAWFIDGTPNGTNALVATTISPGNHSALLKVTDSHGASSSDTASINIVQDNVPPTVTCNTASFTQLPATLAATVSDQCGAATVSIPSYECWSQAPGGRLRNVTSTCTVSVVDGQLTVSNPGGSLGYIKWVTRASDANGNATIQSCQTNYDVR